MCRNNMATTMQCIETLMIVSPGLVVNCMRVKTLKFAIDVVPSL